MDTGFQGIKSLFRHPDFGLLVIRAAVGSVLAFAGYNKFMEGEKVLHAIGANIKYLGLDVGTQNISTMFFGCLAAGSELVGGLLLVIGFLYRTSAVFLFMTMVVASLMMFDTSQGDLSQFGYPMVIGLVVLGLLFTGPGQLSVQKS
ncbi:MAG TPA: DoxX family protein [Oceanipulchritudo sp.]|nr:DoxX family protein [Oceanipulchritudo sp.]